RFVASMADTAPALNQTRRHALAEGQEPFAIVLGCSDSRVPAELVFDQGLGDLFVIRVAGNIVAPSQVGSVEFAAARFGTRLVVVLGHSQCGAVVATLDELQGRGTAEGPAPALRPVPARARDDRRRAPAAKMSTFPSDPPLPPITLGRLPPARPALHAVCGRAVRPLGGGAGRLPAGAGGRDHADRVR